MRLISAKYFLCALLFIFPKSCVMKLHTDEEEYSGAET